MGIEDFDSVFLITGALVDKEKALAKCHCDRHRGYLSKSLIASHQCLEKQCPFFQKVRMDYWEGRDQAKQKAKEDRKSGLALRKEQEEQIAARNQQIKDLLEDFAPVTVTAILEETKRTLRVCFLSSDYVDFSEILPKIREISGKGIYFRWAKPSPQKPAQ